MEKANQAPVFDLEIAACEIKDTKNLLTAVQWWLESVISRETSNSAGIAVKIEGEVYKSILGTVQVCLMQLQQSMDAAAERGYEVLKIEEVQA